MVSTDHLIRQGDFCEIVSTELENDGLKRGNYVYIAGHKAFPISEEDMYTQRIMFLCHKSSRDGEIDLEAGFYVIDPSSLFKVNERSQKRMTDALHKQVASVKLALEESPSEEVH